METKETKEGSQGQGKQEKDVVRIHIDGKPYDSSNPTTGQALYALGNVQAGLELYREGKGNGEDTPIENGLQIVHLGQGDQFRSRPPQSKEYTIIVNGRKRVVTTRELTFVQVVGLAFDPVPTGPNILFTITYGRGPDGNLEGTLVEGGTVKIKDGMVFNVTTTDKS